MTKKPRRASDALLPRSPLELAWPLHVRGPQAEGAVILSELPAGEAAVALRLLRLVLAFASGAAGAAVLRRETLEEWEAEFQATPRHPLWGPAVTVLAELAAGERADVRRIANGCMAACEWMLERGAWQSALLYAQAAALAWPHNPRLAWAAGRMLRNYGVMREAEHWLRRAARIAVWNGDVETQDLALNSLGNLFAQQGCYQEALRILNRALKLAARVGKTMRAEVSHDLVLVFIAMRQYAKAEEMAIAAFRWYGADHPKLARLAFDVALLWSEQGRFQVALPVLQALLPVHNGSVERVLVIGAMARAAGALGDEPTFEYAWKEAWDAVDATPGPVRSALPAVLAELGAGAASLRDWTRAKEAFQYALFRAEEMGEYDVIARAEEGLASVERHERIPPHQRPSAQPAVQLSRAFVRILEARASGIDPQPRGDGER
ncbi:MAG TPA: tetratricopeptide repeat protein [Longimicrobium sp.]|nr:tetratricopeptide repeat protein [Longimicrobium sp.]